MLERVAELVRQNPAITVQEVARKLGYAEPKSVYYWLQKGRFRGFKEFKKSVLTGVYPERLRRAPSRVREKPTPLKGDLLPLARGLGPGGNPVWVGVSPLPRQDLGERAFALNWASGEYFPLFWAGDQLAIDPDAPLVAGDLALALVNELPVLLRVYRSEAGTFYVHPVTGEPQGNSLPMLIVGRVSALYRAF